MIKHITATSGTPDFLKFSKGKGSGKDHNGRRVASPSAIKMTVVTLEDENGKAFVAIRTYEAIK
jgi:hypothetical protein